MSNEIWKKWRARLKGEKVETFTEPDVNDTGYYRKALTRPGLTAQGQPNGKKIVIGWRPVAVYEVNGQVVAMIDAGNNRKMLTRDQTVELWTWIVQHPIPYDVYKTVFDGGEWPEGYAPKQELIATPTPKAAPADDTVPGADRDVTRSDNNPPEDLPLEQQHAQAIDNAIQAAADWLKEGAIKTEEHAALAFGAKNRLAELRLDADKAGRAIYEPMYREYKKVQSTWAPIVTRAEDQEKKLNKAVLTFREAERLRIANEQAAAKKAADDAAAAEAKRIADEQERNERAADRAIAAGEEPPAPEIEEPAPQPAPAPAPAPAKPAPLTPTYGTRKPREQLKRFAEIEDQAKVYEAFKDNADLKALLLKLAQSEVTAGRDVPGVTVREGLV